MAELSADTQAILNALTEQGKLLRNDGRTNSIKTVNIRLDKFQASFDAMNQMLADISSSMRKMIGGEGAEGTIQVGSGAGGQAAALREVFEGQEDQEEVLEQLRDQMRRQADLDDAELTRKEIEEKEKQEQEKKDRLKKQGEDNLKNLKENTVTGQLMTNPVSFLTKVIKGAMIGFVGFNVIRGVVDAFTGGAMTQFIEDIDWEGLGKGIKSFSDLLFSNKWSAFATVLGSWLLIDFGAPLAVNLVGEALRTNALTTALAKMTPGEITKAPGFFSASKALKFGLLATAGIAIAGITEKLAENVAYENLTDDEVLKAKRANFQTPKSTAISVAGYAAAGATLGSYFGPKGALIGLAIGAAVGAGKLVFEAMQRTTEEKVDVAEIEERLKMDEIEADRLAALEMLKRHAEDASFTLSDAALKSLRIQAGLNPETGEPMIEGESLLDQQLQEVKLETDTVLAEQLNKQKNILARAKASAESGVYEQFVPDGMGGGTYIDITDATRIAELQAQRDANLAEQLNKQKNILARAKASAESGVYEQFVPDGMGGGTYIDITDATRIAELQAQRDANLAEQLRVMSELEARRDKRVAEGADEDNFIYLAPKGFWEGFKDIWEDSSDRREDRLSDFRKMFEEYEGSDIDGDGKIDFKASEEVMNQALDAISSGAITPDQAITIIKAGDTQTNIDSSDKSTNSKYNFSSAGIDALMNPNGG